jgi:hypothetical protein
MTPDQTRLPLSRRDLLKLGSAAAGVALAPAVSASPARAQTPKRGGTLNLRLWDPPHFDPHLTVSYKTHIAYSFTHSRLVKHKAGPGVQPGTFPMEGDPSPNPGPSPTRTPTSSSCAAACAGTTSRR